MNDRLGSDQSAHKDPKDLKKKCTDFAVFFLL